MDVCVVRCRGVSDMRTGREGTQQIKMTGAKKEKKIIQT